MRIVFAVLAAGCASDPTCALEDVVTDRVGQQELEDCGRVRFDDPMTTLAAARDCAIAAQAARTPFRAQLELVTGPERGAVAFLGITEGGEWRTFRVGQAGDAAFTFACTSFSAAMPCETSQLAVDLCLTCEGLALAAQCPEPQPTE
jgi:hypothetical protein